MRLRALLIAPVAALSLLATPLASSVAHAASHSYEAESSANTLSGGAHVTSCSGCSGGKRVGYVGKGGTLKFNGVTAAKAETVKVAIAYVNGGATRSARLSVNGGATTSINFGTTGSWTTAKSLSVSVALKSGSNTLTFSNPTAWAPDFDKISYSDTSSSTPPTAAQLLAKVTSCNQVSNGKFSTDAGAKPSVAICGKNGAVFFKADLDVDCDGQTTTNCNKNTDCCYQNDTTFHQSDGKPLASEFTPYVVLSEYKKIWDYNKFNIQGGAVIAVIYNNQIEYAVFGDTDPDPVTGEASYATAKALGMNPSALNGGVDSGVTYIVFEGTHANPIQDHNSAVSVGQAAAEKFLQNN